MISSTDPRADRTDSTGSFAARAQCHLSASRIVIRPDPIRFIRLLRPSDRHLPASTFFRSSAATLPSSEIAWSAEQKRPLVSEFGSADDLIQQRSTLTQMFELQVHGRGWLS